MGLSASSAWIHDREKNHVVATAGGHELQTLEPDQTKTLTTIIDNISCVGVWTLGANTNK
jgi:hypothetical protein